MNFKIQNGRPENFSERIEVEQKTYEVLDSLHIPYQYIDHPAMATIADCMEVDKILGIEICKNLFLCNEQKTKFYLLLLPGNKKFKTKELSKALGISRLSFASPELMQEHLSLTPGSVTIMGLIHDTKQTVQLVIDREVMQHEYFACHPCINTSSIRLKTEDIRTVFLPALHRTPIYVDLQGENL